MISSVYAWVIPHTTLALTSEVPLRDSKPGAFYEDTWFEVGLIDKPSVADGLSAKTSCLAYAINFY